MRIAAHALVATLALPLAAAQTRHQAANAQTQPALARAYDDYRAGHFAEAANQLEALTQRKPASFDVQELLGLCYAAQGDIAKAEAHLATAVKLQPASVPAHNNLATSLIRLDRATEAEQEWKQALSLAPSDYTANRNLARLYLRQGKLEAALPLLTRAHGLQPEAQDNTFDLASAELLTGHLPEARTYAESLPPDGGTGEVHGLLGQLDEQQGRYIDAVNQFSAAAHLDPSDDNLFAWGSELLQHRAYQAAIEVFRDATTRFPNSPRLWVGLGMALYSRGEYEEAVHALLTAADRNASDPRCYFFLSKAYLSSPSQADAVIEHFRKYAALKPDDALAQFYYAMSLWKGRRMDTGAIDYGQVETLLKRSLALDDTNAEAHLQLGILYNDEHKYDLALPQYQRALALQPNLADAHFRLGRLYLHQGDAAKAQPELDRFKQLQAQHQAEVDKERAEVQQFVIATGAPAATSPQPTPAPHE